jgi:anti-sigma B factor antagonist
MQMTKRVKDGIEILAIKGELDLSNVGVVKTIIDREVASGKINLVIDMKDLEYIDSSGIGVFINTMNKIRALSGKFVLMALKDSVSRIFNLTKLTSFFIIIKEETELHTVFNIPSSTPSSASSPP